VTKSNLPMHPRPSGWPPDRNWEAVYDVVLAGLIDADVTAAPVTTEDELAEIAATVTDHVVAAVELSREQKRAAKMKRRQP
jgi:BarA-like signal transduction histidine kinase